MKPFTPRSQKGKDTMKLMKFAYIVGFQGMKMNAIESANLSLELDQM